jgi:hypothetical protein
MIPRIAMSVPIKALLLNTAKLAPLTVSSG